MYFSEKIKDRLYNNVFDHRAFFVENKLLRYLDL